MRIFAYTSTHIDGQIIVGYNELGLLVTCDLTQVTFALNQHETILRYFPLTLDELNRLVNDNPKDRQITEIIKEISFDEFWEKYNHKMLSHKKKSLARWQKMALAEQIKAYNYVQRYFTHLNKQGTFKMNAETYLNSEIWNN